MSEGRVHVRELVADAQSAGLMVEGWEASPNGGPEQPDREQEPWFVPAPQLGSGDAQVTPWLVEGLLRPGIGFVAAEPKSGKSWLSLEVGIALAAGSPAFGRFEVGQPDPVLYVAEEGSAEEIAYRIRALCRGRDLPIPAQLCVAAGQHVLLDDKGWQARLLKAAEESFSAILFDPLIRMHTGNEDRAEAMRPVNSFLRTLAYAGTSVLVAHHWTKPGENNRGTRLGNRLRGTGDFWALCDSLLYLSRVKGSSDVVVESEHRSAIEEPAWSFSLPTEQDPESVRLDWRPGGVEEIKAVAKAPAVLRAVEDAGMVGITRRKLRDAVGGRATEIDAATHWLVANGKLTRAEERRPDRAGRSRSQVVFRHV